MLEFLKKFKCKLFICCKVSINDENYDERNNENYIIDRIKMTTNV